MTDYPKEFLEQTIELWQPYSSLPLSQEDAREITDNTVELLKFVVELEEKYGKESRGSEESE